MDSSEDQKNKIMTAEEVSKYLRLPMTTVYDLVSKGRLPGAKCGRQWRFMEPDVINYLKGVRPTVTFPAKPHSDLRSYPRIKTEISARVTCALSSLQHIQSDGVIDNLGEGGMCFIPLDSRFEAGFPVRITLALPESREPLTDMEGRVVYRHANPKAILGIKFRNLSEEAQERIRDYVG